MELIPVQIFKLVVPLVIYEGGVMETDTRIKGYVGIKLIVK